MYHFSTPAEEAAYRTAITTASRPYNTVEGTLTFTDPTIDPITISSANLPVDALRISQQCIDKEELMFGGIFAGELTMSLITNVDRYSFFGATIELTYKIRTGTTTGENPQPIYSYVPLGVFTVFDVERPDNKVVNITAYDNTTLLDKRIGGNLIAGYPWEIFNRISTDTTIELAFTQSELENNFPNTDYAFEAAEDHGIKTYRDVVKMLCQAMACFAYADREGKLTVKKFSTSPDLILGNSTTGVYPWYTFVPADYVSKYIGLSVTADGGTYQVVSPDPTEQGLIMDIEDGPGWDLGSDTRLQDQTAEVFTVLHAIQYTPSTLDMPSDATIECGDMIALNVRGGDTIRTLVTDYEWQYHKGMIITSAGANPLIAEDRIENGNRILNQAVAKSKLQFVHFTNPSEVTITSASIQHPVNIADADFTPTGDTDAMVVATILVDATIEDVTETETEEVTVSVKAYNGTTETSVTDIDGNVVSFSGTATNTYTYIRDGKSTVTLFYRLNGALLPNELHPYIATEELENGKHIITVAYPLSGLPKWQRCEFEIYMTVDNGTIVIPANTIKGTVFGQSIDLINRFDGVLKVDEDFDIYPVLGGLGVLDELEDEGTVLIRYCHFIRVSDDLSLYNISGLGTTPLQEGTGALQPQVYMRGGFYLVTEDGKILATENGKKFITE